MKITIEGKEYRVSFSHTQYSLKEGVPTLLIGNKVLPISGVTSCRISMAGSEWQASARCSVKDQFCKATGRKIAFGRALKSAFPDRKEARREAWEGYFDMTS